MKSRLLDLSPIDLERAMAERGVAGYRARQIWSWVIDRRAERFETMTDLPRALRDELDLTFEIFTTETVTRSVDDDGTTKLLLSCRGGETIETVLMAEEHRRTVCVSTQVGCGMGCVFCASGLKGVVRNLTRGEILEQIVRQRNELREGERVSHVVVMGMGESLANLDELLAALEVVCAPAPLGLGLSQRRVTISTVGLPDKMRKLAELDRRYHLAVSLHAATESLRDRLVPISHKVGLGAVIDAADRYFERTGRQVTFEYVLLGGVNDRVEDARALAELMSTRSAHVNLIPYNPVAGLEFERPSDAAIERFTAILRSRSVSVTVRKTKGRVIDAACGQLRRRTADAGSTLFQGGPR